MYIILVHFLKCIFINSYFIFFLYISNVTFFSPDIFTDNIKSNVDVIALSSWLLLSLPVSGPPVLGLALSLVPSLVPVLILIHRPRVHLTKYTHPSHRWVGWESCLALPHRPCLVVQNQPCFSFGFENLALVARQSWRSQSATSWLSFSMSSRQVKQVSFALVRGFLVYIVISHMW